MEEVEYTIYCIWNGGTPFFHGTYSNEFAAKQQLYSMVELEKERNRPYYVDNDFYENEYPASLRGKYFSIKERKVSKWCKYSEKKYREKNNINNIHYINI